jgi:4'-phosphopantetheinyl transferase
VLAPGDVLIVPIPLDTTPGDPAALSDEERVRLSRMRSAAKRREFLVGRSSMRRVLGALTATPAHEVVLRTGDHGKPAIEGAPLHFNLSHSADRAVLAVSTAGALGIDIEAVAPRRPFARLARRFFAGSEIEWFEAHAPADRRAAFYRMWTLKEAYLKALGTGLSVSSRAFEVAVEGDSVELASPPPGVTAPGSLRLETLPADEGYVVSICTPADAVNYRHENLTDIAGGSP